MHTALDGGAIVAGAGAFTFRLTVPGGVLPAAGVTVVGVLPTHRRRGILRAMMRAQLDGVHERGEPLAALWASEETIYGRYGYGLASLSLELDIPRIHAAFRPGVELVGGVRLVDAAEAAKLMPAVHDAVQVVTPGMYERTAAWWEQRTLIDLPEFRFGAGPKIYAVLEVGGVAQAYALYRLNVSFGNFGPETKVQPQEVIGVTPAATASIWRYLLDVDWTQTVAARLLAADHPLLLLLARLNLSRPTLSDGLWVRLVDVGAALSGRSYAGDGAVVLDVRDEFCEWNAGRWRVEGGEAVRTDADADLALDVADLASVYLGGFTFRELWRAQQVEELREGGLERADELLRTDAAPWCPEIF
jgi:predicted acetyltransferase